jgi:multidrug efflux pump subunit AcrA (membrane-fusion protein)
MSARIQPDLPETPALQAKIVLVDRVIDTASNSFRVRMDLPNPGHALPAGVRCKADFGLPAVAKSTEKAKTPQVTPSAMFAPPALGAAARTSSRVGVPPPAAKPVAATLHPAAAPTLSPRLPQTRAVNPASGAAGSPAVRQPMSGLAPTQLRLSTKIALGNLAQP